MERKKYQTRIAEVEAVEFEDSFKVFLPDGHVAFEPKDKFLAKYEPKAEPLAPCTQDGPVSDAPLEPHTTGDPSALAPLNPVIEEPLRGDDAAPDPEKGEQV